MIRVLLWLGLPSSSPPTSATSQLQDTTFPWKISDRVLGGQVTFSISACRLPRSRCSKIRSIACTGMAGDISFSVYVSGGGVSGRKEVLTKLPTAC